MRLMSQLQLSNSFLLFFFKAIKKPVNVNNLLFPKSSVKSWCVNFYTQNVIFSLKINYIFVYLNCFSEATCKCTPAAKFTLCFVPLINLVWKSDCFVYIIYILCVNDIYFSLTIFLPLYISFNHAETWHGFGKQKVWIIIYFHF